LSEGKEIQIHEYLNQEEINKIEVLFQKLEEFTQLKPYYEALNREIDYGKIRLCLTFLQMSMKH